MKGTLPETTFTALTLNNGLVIASLLTIFWLFIVILVNPIGNFPLNDDWAYGWAVKNLLQTGTLQLSDWTAPNLVSQVAFGALFCLPFGFSFTYLRLSTLTLGLTGVVATYGLLREVNASQKYSIFGAFIVAINPLYFVLSNSFMSDIPSFTFFTLSLYFLIRGLRQRAKLEMTIGILISFIAILDRQSNLVILPSFSLAYLSKNGLQLRNIIYSAAVTITGVALYILYSQWLKLTGRAPALYNTQAEQILVSLSSGIRYVVSICADDILIISIYLGLFLFPFLLVELSRQYQGLSSQQKKVAFSPALVVAAVIAVVLAKYHRMPLTGNVLEFFALGTQGPDGYQAFLDPRSINLIGRGWQILTALGVLGAALLVKHFVVAIIILFTKAEKPELDCGHNRKWLLIFVIALSVASCLPIVLLPKDYWYDRYLIIFLPLMMMMVVLTSANKIVLTSANKIIARKVGFGATCTSVALALFYGVFTISGTHDYLGSNRVRWEALNNLTQVFQLLPEQIDGKFEFNGWYFGNKLQICNPQYDNIAEQSRPTWSDFKCLYDNGRWQYTVSFVRQPGYSLANEYSFRRWLPWREETLYLLHKNTNSNEQTR